MFERTDCVILAAGASTRMGLPKLHLPFGETTVLGETLGHALAAGLRAIVVGRPDDGELEEYAIEDSVLIVRNMDPSRGMLSSLHLGLAHVESERFFFLPGDMPLVSTPTYLRLLAARHGGPVIPTVSGRKGHPVLVPSSLIGRILALGEGQTLRELLEEEDRLLLETGDEGAVIDIDDPNAYVEALLRAKAPGGAARKGRAPRPDRSASLAG